MPVSLRQFRKDIATLKRKGIIPAKVDARNVQPSKHYRAVIRQNRDVIEGKASVVKVPKGNARIASDIATRRKITRAQAIAEAQGGRSRAKHGRVIIEHSGGQKIVYDKKSGALQTYIINAQGERIKGIIKPTGQDFHALQAQGYSFHIFFNRGKGRPPDRRSWSSADEMIADMNMYKDWKGWQDYVIITKTRKPNDEDEENYQ